MDEPYEYDTNSNLNKSPAFNRISIVDDFGGSASPNLTSQTSQQYSITSGPINIDLSQMNTSDIDTSNNEIGIDGSSSKKVRRVRRTKNERTAKTNKKDSPLKF